MRRHRILVVGATGVLGQHVVAELNQIPGYRVLSGSRSGRGADGVVIDAKDLFSIERAVTQADVVVSAVPQVEPLIQRVCACAGVPCVDISPGGDLLDRAQSEVGDTGTSLVMMCGLYPGLSGLVARHVANQLDDVRDLHVGLLQSTNARVGPTGVKDMLRQIAVPVQTPHGTRPGFSLKRRMTFLGNTATVRQISYDESDVLRAGAGVETVFYYTAWSSPAFNLVIAFLRGTGILRALVNSTFSLTPKHRPGKAQTVYLAAEAEGTADGKPSAASMAVEVSSDYGATARVAAAVTRLILEEPDAVPGGVYALPDFVDLGALVQLLGTDGIRFTHHVTPGVISAQELGKQAQEVDLKDQRDTL